MSCLESMSTRLVSFIFHNFVSQQLMTMLSNFFFFCRYLQVEKLGIKTFPLSEHENALKAFRSGLYTKIMFTV